MNVKKTYIQCEYGEFELFVFRVNGIEIPVLYKNGNGTPVLRIQSQCFLGFTFGSRECDCKEQFERVMHIIENTDHAILIFLINQEARGYGLYRKIDIINEMHNSKSLELARKKLGVEKDKRSYEIAVEILNYMEISQVKLLSTDKRKIHDLEVGGIKIEEIMNG